MSDTNEIFLNVPESKARVYESPQFRMYRLTAPRLQYTRPFSAKFSNAFFRCSCSLTAGTFC